MNKKDDEKLSPGEIAAVVGGRLIDSALGPFALFCLFLIAVAWVIVGGLESEDLKDLILSLLEPRYLHLLGWVFSFISFPVYLHFSRKKDFVHQTELKELLKANEELTERLKDGPQKKLGLDNE